MGEIFLRMFNKITINWSWFCLLIVFFSLELNGQKVFLITLVAFLLCAFMDERPHKHS